MSTNDVTDEEIAALLADLNRRLPPTHVLEQDIRDIEDRADARMMVFAIVVVVLLVCVMAVAS